MVTKPTSVSHEYGDRKWVGFGKFCEAIKEDPVLYTELSNKILETRDAKLEAKLKEQEDRKASRELEAKEIKKKLKKGPEL